MLDVLSRAALIGALTLFTGLAGTFIASAQSLAPNDEAVVLNGPWKFHLGDDAQWANSAFDDSKWESVDLTAPPGAHDTDVGISRFVPGWQSRGHAGVDGYAWYRIHASIDSRGKSLAIVAPTAVDSAYQIFVNGGFVGEDGDFTGPLPRVFSIRPRVFRIPANVLSSADNVDLVVAVRVWMGSWELADPQGGGIRVAPVLATFDAAYLRYEAGWIETLRGYVVEVFEAAAFVGLCAMLWLVGRSESSQNRSVWILAALLCTAAYRLNQAVFFWGQFETVPAFEIVSGILLYPLCLATWTLGWARYLSLKEDRLKMFVWTLLGLYMACLIASNYWFSTALPANLESALAVTISIIRLIFLGINLYLFRRAVRSRLEQRWILAVAMILVAIGQFAPELSRIGIPGIWFPFDTGVSRTQFAYAAFDVSFLIFLWTRLVAALDRSRISRPDFETFEQRRRRLWKRHEG
jgi:hypothetical protein